MLAVVEALKQLDHECSKDKDLSPDIKLEKAVCLGASVLSTFTSFPKGKVALGQYHLGSLQEVVHLYIFVS